MSRLLPTQIIGVFTFNYAQITLYAWCYIIVLRRDARRRFPLSVRTQAFRQNSRTCARVSNYFHDISRESRSFFRKLFNQVQNRFLFYELLVISSFLILSPVMSMNSRQYFPFSLTFIISKEINNYNRLMKKDATM